MLVVVVVSTLLWVLTYEAEREAAAGPRPLDTVVAEIGSLRRGFRSFLDDVKTQSIDRDTESSLIAALGKREFEQYGLDDVILVSSMGGIFQAGRPRNGDAERTRPILAAILQSPSLESRLAPSFGLEPDPITSRLIGEGPNLTVLLVVRLADMLGTLKGKVDATHLLAIGRLSRSSAPEALLSDLATSDPVVRAGLRGSIGEAETTTARSRREELAPILMSGLMLATVLFAIIALYFHRTTKDLAQTEAASKSLLGRDPLSGLGNRLFLNERLDTELSNLARGGPGFAVLFIDLDRFKDVNDSYGHQAGDELIRLVADRMRETLGERDTLARLGGDEFAVLGAGITEIADAEALARSLLDALTKPFVLTQSPVAIGASIGVALAPEHACDREGLMKLADTALYQAKSEGRNRACFFQSRMVEAIRMRKVVEEELRLAIENDELVLHYQPLFSADGSRIVGLEALVRWPHPVRGLISPAEFIPIAEERGLVIPLGDWVLRRACRDGCRWPDLRIAVNVSAIQFRHRDFVPTVVETLGATGFDPARLELELTEGVVVADADAAEEAMVELRALGIHLALDDFGTGYSSLIYLRRFAFDKIKIDRSFLESMEVTGESAILVHSIVHLGRALGLVVTAEGVETSEQHRFLQALGCHQLQGYLFSRPVPADEIDRLLTAEAARSRAA